MKQIARDILTPEQAAAYLQVNRETVYRYIRDGRLLASRMGRSYRIPKRNIDLLLASSLTRRDIQVREYSDQELRDFLEADQLDNEAGSIARNIIN